MAIKHERHDYEDVTLLVLQGDLGKPEAADLQNVIVELINQGRAKIVLDLEDIRYADSCAILTLLRMDRECMALQGEIKLLRPRSVVKRFMSIGQVLELFDRFETRVEAVNSFRKPRTHSPSSIDRMQDAARRQKMVLIRLIELLNRKGFFTADEFTNEYNRSAQLVLAQLRIEIQS